MTTFTDPSLHDDERDADLDWLSAHRPHPVALDETATLRARALLMEDMAEVGADPRVSPPARARRPARVRGLARLALGAVAAGGIAVAVVLATGGPGVTTDGTRDGSARLSLAGGVPEASAAPLVRLSDRLHARATSATTAPLPGDATLIIRHHRYPDARSMTGADLFADDGSYYFAQDPKDLPEAIASIKADKNPADDWAFVKRDVAAAEAAFDGPIDAARERLANAAFPDGRAPAAAPPGAADPALAEKLKAAGRTTADRRPISAEEQLENRLWGNAMDALNAGAARPAVRAGVLHLLATVDSVTVAKAEDGGRDVLVLTAALPGEDAYAERLTIDAATGMPLRFTGGEPGRAPSVTVTYDVSRVSVADVAKR